MTQRLRHVATGLAALVALAGLLGAIPWALWHFVSWPLPHHVPSAAEVGRALGHRGIPAHALVDALAVVVWLAWASLVASVAAELAAGLAGHRARRLPVAGVFQPLAGRLVAAIVVAGLALAPRPGPHPATTSLTAGLPAARRPVPVLVRADANATFPASSTQPSAEPPSAAGASAPRTYLVRRGDTLWGIAQRELGDPLRWSQIYQLNEGRPQPGGTALTDPHWIDPGWTLLLPAAPPPTRGPQPSGPPPSPAPSPVPPAATAPTTTTPHTPASTSPARHAGVAEEPEPPAPVPLGSGGVVAGSFAAGVLSAVTARRLRRRRAYRPVAPRPGLRLVTPGAAGSLGDLLAAARRTRCDEDRDFCDPAPPPPKPLDVVPDAETIARPDLLEVAHRDGQSVALALGDWPGLRLAGPGAEAALRAWLATLVTRDGPYAAEVLVPAGLAERLLPGVDLPSVRRVEDTERLLGHLEAAVVGRTRRLEEAEAPDAAAYRRRSPEDPFPLLLAVVDDVPPEAAPRWSAILAAAARLGLGALVLAADHGVSGPGKAGGAQLIVGADGTLGPVAPQTLADLLAGASLFSMDAPSATVLDPVAAVHNDIEPDQAEPDQAELEQCEPDRTGGPPDASPDTNGTARTPGDAIPAPNDGADDAATTDWPAPRQGGPDNGAPISVRLLGPAEVCAFGEKVQSGLRASAYELLAWYALRPAGASAEAAIDAIWPDTDARRGRERFWTALGNLRSRLHGPGKDGPEILTKAGEHYRPDPAILDVDLWRFEAALGDAARAEDPRRVAAALESAVAAYGGDLCPGLDALWAEPVREDLHRRALDAHVRLAESYADDQPERALAVLEKAVEIDPICEDLYRRLLTLQADLGRPDTARRTWRLLQGRLADLDLDPEPETEELIGSLLPAPPTTVRPLPPRRY